MSENPYLSSDSPDDFSPPASDDKPIYVQVLGIINLVFAAMGMCSLVFSTAIFTTDIIPQNANVPNPTLELFANNLGYRIFMIIGFGLGFIFSVVLAVGGVGLLKWRRYGRSATIAYAWYSIVMGVVSFGVNAFFVFGPMIRQAQQAQGAQSAAAVGGAIGGIVGGIIGACSAIGYAVVLLYFLNRPRAIRALS